MAFKFVATRALAPSVFGWLFSIAAGVNAQGPALGFDEALRLGLAQAPRLAAQRAAVAAAEAIIDRAAELPDPKLRFGIENLPISGADALRYDRDFQTMRRIGVMQEIPNSDKRRARSIRAAGEHSVQQASLQAQRALLARDTALAWLDVYYAEQATRVQATLAAELKLAADAIPAGITAGRARPADLFAAQSAVGLAADRALDQERLAARARANLAAYIGANADRVLGAAPEIRRLAVDPDRLLGDLHNHPVIHAAAERERLAQADIDLERAAKRSDWSVELLYGQRSPTFSNMVSLMFSVDLPFFAERRQDRDIAAKLAAAEQARALTEESRRMHEAEVRGALADWRSIGQRLERYDAQLLPLARNRVEAAVAAFGGGRGELATVLDARRAEAEARIARLQLEADRARAWANLNFLVPAEPRP